MNFIQFAIGIVFIIGLVFLSSNADWKKETADFINLIFKKKQA